MVVKKATLFLFTFYSCRPPHGAITVRRWWLSGLLPGRAEYWSRAPAWSGRPRAQGGVCPGALRTLETQQDAALRQLREDLQSESGRHVRDLEQRLRDQEAAKQLEVGRTCMCVSATWQGGEALEGSGWDRFTFWR